jgi:hypothetical protein
MSVIVSWRSLVLRRMFIGIIILLFRITPHEPASSLFEPICEARIARRDIVQSQRWRLRIRDQLEKGSGQEEKP